MKEIQIYSQKQQNSEALILAVRAFLTVSICALSRLKRVGQFKKLLLRMKKLNNAVDRLVLKFRIPFHFSNQTFPDHDLAQIILTEIRSHLLVSISVAFKLCDPVPLVGFRHVTVAASLVVMPETSIHKNCGTKPAKVEIRLSGNF